MKREPKIADIAEKIGERPDRLAELIRGVKSLKAVSLDASVGRPEFGREGSLGETIEAAQEARPDLSTAEMETLLQPLRPKQRYIVLRRYGLDGQPAATLQEISRRLGLSRERVRQLQADAIRRLRDRATRMLEPGAEDPGIMPGRRRLDVRALIAGISTDPQDILPAPKLKQQPARGGRAEWNEMFEALHDYKRRTGHCRVPRNYWPDLRLANWVVAQKAKCRRGDLSERRMRLLVSIGFSWLSPRALAESMLARLEAFHAEHGHSRVPDAHPFTDLHAWCKSLKRAWMSPARLRRLERIGFPWEAVSETKSS
jgi:DNA-binding CsgD family transcriptional regulator